MNDFMNLPVLGTFSGMVAATAALTQVLKQYVRRADPKWVALFVAAVLVSAVQVIAPNMIMFGAFFCCPYLITH